MSALQMRPDGTKSMPSGAHSAARWEALKKRGVAQEGAQGASAFGRKVKGVKVYAEDTVDYLELLVRRYQQHKSEDDLVQLVRERAQCRRAGAVRSACPQHGELRERHRRSGRAVLLPVLR